MEFHGDEDLRDEPSERDLELALEEIVECILEEGQWPRKGRAMFDLYDFLHEVRDSSYALEMYVAALSGDGAALEARRARERRSVEAMLIEPLRNSDIVADLAAEYAAGDE